MFPGSSRWTRHVTPDVAQRESGDAVRAISGVGFGIVGMTCCRVVGTGIPHHQDDLRLSTNLAASSGID